MLSASRRNILISISHGFHIRNFLETKFMLSLSAAYDVVIVVDMLDVSALDHFLKKHNYNVIVEGVVIKEHFLEKYFIFFRKNIFVSPKRANTKNLLNELSSNKLRHFRVILSALNHVFGKFEFSRSLWRGIEGWFVKGTEFNSLMERYKPAKIVTANYGTEPFEIRLLRCTKRCGIKSISIVPSWDNLTSKGVMGIKPDYLAVWNDIMLQEAVELHAFKPERIFVTGPLQFDPFFDKDFVIAAEAFQQKFGIKKGQPVIVYGTITPKYFKYNLEVLQILKEAVANGTIVGNPKIVVRVHPQVVKDPIFGDNMQQYLALGEGNDIFSFSIPEIEEWPGMQVPKASDFLELISILTHARICIASASTLIFDSFACNTSFIGIGFDGYHTHIPKTKSVRRMFEFEHYKNVYKIGGFYIAESQAELIDYVNRYLSDEKIHQKERHVTLEQQIKFRDGLNYKRVLNAIEQI